MKCCVDVLLSKLIIDHCQPKKEAFILYPISMLLYINIICYNYNKYNKWGWRCDAPPNVKKVVYC